MKRTTRLRLLFSLPAITLAAVIVLLSIGFRLGEHNIHPSALLGQPFPNFNTLTLVSGESIDQTALPKNITLVNVWASWCAACRTEHALLHEIEALGDVIVVGINYKDHREDAIDWLSELGNPYNFILVDFDGRIGVELGVYGAPETFLLDAHGIIRHKHVGPLDREIWNSDFLPIIESI